MSAPASRTLYDPARLALTQRRLVAQLLERHPRFEGCCLIGLQPRGVHLSRRIHHLLDHALGRPIPYGELDVTFHRDDFRRRQASLEGAALPYETRLDFSVEGLHVILADDVLYTGRTIRAALDALLSFGRPKAVELLVLIDRLRRRELPIEPDYSGIRVETLASEKVLVEWAEVHGADRVYIQQRPDSV